MKRGLTLDVFLADDAKYHAVKNSIAHYRHVARSVFGTVFAAQAAGATTDIKDEYFRVIPNNERAKQILALVFDKTGKAPVYEARDYVMKHLSPTWLSFVWDSLRTGVWSRWQAKDPELNAQRGYLALNGVRRLALCAHIGIEFPVKTARPNLDDHTVILKWDHNIGEVAFKIPRLDSGRWRVWHALVSGEMPHGTVTLNERYGKFRISLAYDIPDIKHDLDTGSILEVRFADDHESALRCVHGQSLDALSAVSVLHELLRLKAQAMRFERERAAAGSSYRRWGSKRIFRATQQRVSRCTLRRERVVAHWNHLWTRRIIDNVLRWKCGVIKVVEQPETLCGISWPFAEWRKMLEYKAQEHGVTVMA